MLEYQSRTVPITLAGFPATTEKGFTFRVTTLPAPTTEPRPIVTPFKIRDLAPINVSSSMLTFRTFVSLNPFCPQDELDAHRYLL